MKIYEFTLILPHIDDAAVDAIYGLCQDSSIGKTHGTMYATFDRKSVSLEAALNSAIADLRKLGIEPLRVEIDVPAVAIAS